MFFVCYGAERIGYPPVGKVAGCHRAGSALTNVTERCGLIKVLSENRPADIHSFHKHP